MLQQVTIGGTINMLVNYVNVNYIHVEPIAALIYAEWKVVGRSHHNF